MSSLAAGWYPLLVRPLLFALEPERAHHFALATLAAAPRVPGGLALLRSFSPPAEPVTLFGLQFRNRIGLAAGFDKNGIAVRGWEALGFGFVEVGTVTAQPQQGNPKPRVFRYPKEGALINRLGFNNDGADVIAKRLRDLKAAATKPAIPIGINIGKTKVTPLKDAAADYLYSFQRLHPVADYIALNVSSPNTPGLRSLQEHEALIRLLSTVTEANDRLARPRPILLKIAPDLPKSAYDDIVIACERFRLAGIVATNTTLDHSAIKMEDDQSGGLSGRPLRTRATEVVRQLRVRTLLPIIATGGIEDIASAQEKFAAGANLIQLYTGFVFRGPRLLREIGRRNKGMTRHGEETQTDLEIRS